MSEETIKSLANCERVVTRGKVVDWDIADYDGNEVDVVDIPDAELCKPSLLVDTVVFNHGISHEEVHLVCNKLGGQLPTFEDSGGKKDSYRQLTDLFSKAVKNVKCKASEYINTDDVDALKNLNISDDIRDGDTYFWTGIVENEAGLLVNEYTNEPLTFDPNIWPGPQGIQNRSSVCTMARGEFLVKKDCLDTVPCGVCNLQESQKRLKLKGLCVDDMKANSDFDTDFYAYGLVNDRIHFRCSF